MSQTIWTPQPKQALFMSRPEYECLYGGAAGGGKSDALLAEALRQVHIPNYRGLIIRATYPQLEGLISRSIELYKQAFPKAVFNKAENVWKFPSGAKIFFGYMQHENDKYKYQGKAYDFIAFDELTHFSQSQYEYLISRNRPMGPGTRCYMRATANPDGKGMGWVKSRFVTPAVPGTTIWETATVHDPNGTARKIKRSRIYIPSTIFDNKKLLENDPNYLASLAMLPEAQRNALLYGSWDSFTGQVFTEWRNDPEHYQDRLWTHVIDPFDIPDSWKIVRGFDFGFAKPFAVGWFAVPPKGTMDADKIFMIKEYYGWNGTPNTGLKIWPQEIAKNIRDIENNDPMLKGRRITGPADPSIWDESRGESIARMMERAPYFVTWDKGSNNRLAGKMQFHYRLAFNEYGEPLFQVFNTCTNFIRNFPLLIYSDKHPEDIETEMEDHDYDMARYVLASMPIGPRQNVLTKIDFNDPLNQRINTKTNKSLYINL